MIDVYYQKYRHGLLILGNTYYYKKTLLSLGGIWNDTLKGYLFGMPKLSKLIEYGIYPIPE